MASVIKSFGKALGIGLNDEKKNFQEVARPEVAPSSGGAEYEQAAAEFQRATDLYNSTSFNPMKEQYGKMVSDAQSKIDALSEKEKKAVSAAKKQSTAGQSSGRQGTISSGSAPQATGSLLGGSNIGSKTLLGQ